MKKDKKRKNHPAADKLTRKEYEKELESLHGELVELQQWVVHKGLKVCIVFEGRDGAGKGGTIKAITERVSPRIFRVVALPAPTEREKSQMYIQRYMRHFPAAGEIVIFDRSWYNRAGVERVMGFTGMDEVKRFLRGIPLVEKAIVSRSTERPARYSAAIGPADVSRRDLDVLVERVNAGRVVPLVAQLVRDRTLTAAEITELKQLIDEAERKSRGGSDMEEPA